MKKKILSLALVVAMVALVAAGSLAYFTDTKTATNVMAIGDIEISLAERTKNANGQLVTFAENAVVPMLPMSNDDGITAYNKVVDVSNVGENDAYIRTIVAIESWVLPGYEEEDRDNPTDYVTVIHTANSNQVTETKYNPMKIGDKYYMVLVYDQATDAPIKTDEKVQSLQSIWFDTTVDQDDLNDLTNDGTENKLEVLVLAQGIQADGFSSYADAMGALGNTEADIKEALVAAFAPATTPTT